MENNKLIRLQKYIASCGIASRRKAEQLILQNKVMVNYKIVNELGFKIDPEKDVVCIDGEIIKPQDHKIYILLNKPVGYITSVKDQFNRPTVMELINDVEYRVFPVGRLDYDTSGLLLFTNDGDLANKITHPKHKIDKTYIADIVGIPDKASIDRLREGITIDNYKTSPAKVKILKIKGNITSIKITIHEGKNRQVRKMFDAIGHRVIKLKRIAIGNITLGKLKEGKWRYLNKKEVEYLKRI